MTRNENKRKRAQIEAKRSKGAYHTMGISNVIALLSGVALFLFGMTLMGDGLKKVAGNKLELVLYKLSGNPIKGVLLGTGVTAIIQSSSATSVMVVGFVNSGMMKVKQAIGIIMGAILGTSVTGWIICLSALEGGSGWVSLLSTATLTGVVAVIGIILRMFCKKQSKVHIGDILMGFAVLMFGMQAMSGSVAPLQESEAFLHMLTTFSNPILGILVGLIFTCVLQSASAAVGILQALAATGVVTFSVAFPLIMGIAIGAAMPVLLSSLGANVNGKRTAFVYLLIDVLGAVIWSVIFYGVNSVVHFGFVDATMNAVSIAFLNTLFRFATVLVLTLHRDHREADLQAHQGRRAGRSRAGGLRPPGSPPDRAPRRGHRAVPPGPEQHGPGSQGQPGGCLLFDRQLLREAVPVRGPAGRRHRQIRG